MGCRKGRQCPRKRSQPLDSKSSKPVEKGREHPGKKQQTARKGVQQVRKSSNLPDSQYSINASSGKRAAHCSIETSEREGKE